MPTRGRPVPPRGSALGPGRGAGRWAARVFAGILAAGITLACGTNSALAASDPGSAGLRVGLAGTAAAPQMTLTNGSSAPCQVPDAGLGTFAITQVTQGGKTVEPVSYSAWFDDWVPDYLATQLRTLAPGQSLTVPMPVVTTTATGTALESASWVGPDTSTDALYPIKAGQPVQVWMNYAATVTTDGTVPLCTGSDTSAKATLAAGGGSGSSSGKIAGIPRMTLIYAGAGVIVLLLLALFVFLRVRKHRSSAVTNAVVVLALVACGMMLSTASAPQASATVFLGPGNGNLSSDFKFCMSSFAAPGGDPSNIMSTVQGSGVSVQVVDGAGDENHEIQLLPKQLQIFWDPTDTHPYVGGGNADKCTTLYHELDHAYQDLTGGQTRSDCWTYGPDGKLHDSGLPTNEVQATREQNMLRSNLGLQPRKTYGSTPLPSGECHPPPPNDQPQPKACAGNGCGNSNGDPHLITFDGVRYDFQAVGEFVAADDPTDGFQIQVRQQQFTGSQTIAVNTAVAMDVDGDRVQVGLSSQGLALLVNGKVQSDTSVALPHGGKVAAGYGSTGETMTVTWSDSSTAVINQISVWGLHLAVTPAAAHAGHLRGLLGDLSTGTTAAAPGIQAADGTTITKPSFSTLYPAFANGWRITDATSLFTYTPGTSTATYTDLSFPHAPATIKSVPDLAAATAQCTNAGITDPTTLEDCELDVGLTGESAFADADAQSQPGQAIPPPTRNGGAFGIDGGPATATVTAPDGSTSLQFTGAAGQVVFVDVPKSTLTNQCDVLELKDPRNNVLNQGCILNGSGSIQASTLPYDGTYSVLIGPATKPGTATVQLYQDFDQTAAITPDGPPVTATIGQPGAKSVFTFDAGPGTSVYVEVTSTNLPSQCGVPELLSPSGSDIAEGCSINGSGSISETTLQASGKYEILVNPSVPDTGTAVIKLITDHDQTVPIVIGGPAVTSVISVPGEKSLLTFQGVAGESVSVQASGSTLPSACGDFDLYGPGDDELATACILNGTGSIPATKLPATGLYTIQVVPSGGVIGSTVIRLTAG